MGREATRTTRGRFFSRGSALLWDAGETPGAVAERSGAAERSAFRWMYGDARPEGFNVAVLWEKFNIPPNAWSEKADKAWRFPHARKGAA